MADEMGLGELRYELLGNGPNLDTRSLMLS
jgi:hypothetical protein